MFAIPVKDPEGYGLDGLKLTIGNLGTSRTGWESEVGNSPSRPFFTEDEYIWWGEATGLPIEVGQSADFWFTTVPTSISSGTGLAASIVGGFAPAVLGTVAAPVAPDPLKVTIANDISPLDDGLVSLREAVGYANKQPANEEQDITFGWTGAKTITLLPANGEIALNKWITITGFADPERVTIQRDPGTAVKHRLFVVDQAATVELYNLDLAHGEVDSVAGGAILSEGDLTLSGCIIRQNKATASTGGGIAAKKGSLNITNTTLTGNSSSVGGAIYIGQRVGTGIDSSTITLNTASLNGGGIYIESSNTVDATYVSLGAVDVNGNQAANQGGGIYVSGPISGAGTVLTLGVATIRNNQVLNTNPLQGRGGGLFFGSGTLILAGVTFQDNTAATGDGMYRLTGTVIAPLPLVFYVNNTEVVGAP